MYADAQEASTTTINKISTAIVQLEVVIREAISIPVQFNNLPLVHAILNYWQWRQQARKLIAVSCLRKTRCADVDFAWSLAPQDGIEDRWSMRSVQSLLEK
jgi:hypothetical protein